MAGLRDLLAAIPPILTSQVAITNPNKSLTTCRIYGSNDPQYGTIGWTPPATQDPFAVLKIQGFTTANTEANRLWVTYQIPIFIAVQHADTPFVLENYNDQALAWGESMMQVVSANRRLLPLGASVSPVAGDTQWLFLRGGVKEAHQVFNIPYYGIECDTTLRIVYAVNYQA